MGTNFPGSLDSYSTKGAGDTIAEGHVNDIQDAIEALETKVGIGAGMPTGLIMQIVNTQTGEAATGTTVMPADDTIPQKTEGDEYMTLAITPKSATNKLKIDVVAIYEINTNVATVVALFQDAIANSLKATYVSGYATGVRTLTFSHYMTSGTTSPITFRVRIGTTGGGTITFNGDTGVRRLGGALASSITITEIKV